MKPNIFVGSSTENLKIAYAIQQNLEYDAHIAVWTQGIFALSKATLDSLLAQLDRSDFGIFVLAPNDLTTIRGTQFQTARDNVVFETGLFFGRLGKDRTFLVIPREEKDLHLPTDLLGITPATFDPQGSDADLVARLGAACGQIRTTIRAALLTSFYYRSHYPDTVANTVLSPMLADSPFTFSELLNVTSKSIFLAAQNHYRILVMDRDTTTKGIFEFLRKDPKNNKVRIMACDPNRVNEFTAWAYVTRQDFAAHLQQSVGTLEGWVREALGEGLGLDVRLVPFVPVSVSFVDPEDESGFLVFAPNFYEKTGGKRACYLLSRKEHRQLFFSCYQAYEDAFHGGRKLC